MASLLFKKLSDGSIRVVRDDTKEFIDICESSEAYKFLQFIDTFKMEFPDVKPLK